MTSLVLIALLIFAACIGTMIARYGIPASLAEAFRRLPTKQRRLVAACCWGISIIGVQGWIIFAAGLWWVWLICLAAAGTAGYLLWRRAGRPHSANIVFWVEAWTLVSLFISLIF